MNSIKNTLKNKIEDYEAKNINITTPKGIKEIQLSSPGFKNYGLNSSIDNSTIKASNTKSMKKGSPKDDARLSYVSFDQQPNMIKIFDDRAEDTNFSIENRI